MKQNGLALAYASPELKNDYEIVSEAVKQNGAALEFASPKLRNDKALLLAAAKRNEEAHQDVPQELIDNKNLRSRIFNAFIRPMTALQNRVNTSGSSGSGSRSSAETPLLRKDKTNLKQTLNPNPNKTPRI